MSVDHPLLHGIVDGLRTNASGIVKALDANSNNTAALRTEGIGIIIVDTPITYTTKQISMWPYIIAMGLTYAQKNRMDSMLDVLNYETLNGRYPYSDFISLKDIDVNHSYQYTFAGITEPLKSNIMSQSLAYTWKHPELFWTVSKTASGRRTVILPEYFSSQNYKLDDNNYLYRDCESGYSNNFACVRDGVSLSGVRDVYDKGFSMREWRLMQDIMSTFPDAVQDGQHYGYYKYGAIASGIPLLTMTDDFTIGDYFGTPRELGLFMVCPGNLATPAVNITNTAAVNNVCSWWVRSSLEDSYFAATSYNARVYCAIARILLIRIYLPVMLLLSLEQQILRNAG